VDRREDGGEHVFRNSYNGFEDPMTDDEDDRDELADDDQPRTPLPAWPVVVRASNTPRTMPADRIRANQARPHRFDR
jgi:hypothetical protein